MSFKTATRHYFPTAGCWQIRLRASGSIVECYLCGERWNIGEAVAALHAQQY